MKEKCHKIHRDVEGRMGKENKERETERKLSISSAGLMVGCLLKHCT